MYSSFECSHNSSGDSAIVVSCEEKSEVTVVASLITFETSFVILFDSELIFSDDVLSVSTVVAVSVTMLCAVELSFTVTLLEINSGVGLEFCWVVVIVGWVDVVWLGVIMVLGTLHMPCAGGAGTQTCKSWTVR